MTFLDAKELLMVSESSKSLTQVPYNDFLWKVCNSCFNVRFCLWFGQRLCHDKLGVTGALPPSAPLWREFYAKRKCKLVVVFLDKH